MSDVFTELDEMERQEKLDRLWNKYGGPLILFVLFTILATAAYSGYKAWVKHKNQTQTSALTELLEAPNFPENIHSANLSSLSPEIKSMLLLQAAAAHLNDDQIEDAKTLYGRIINDETAPSDFKSLAQIANFRIESDDKKNVEAINQIAQSNDNPWRYHAALALAIHYATQQNYESAIQNLSLIETAANIPNTLKTTAQTLQRVYRLEQSQNAPNAQTPSPETKTETNG